MSSTRSRRNRGAPRGPISKSARSGTAKSPQVADALDGARRAGFQIGGPNVFADLGFSAEESASLLLRSNLMMALRERLEELGLTQSQAAQKLGVTQPRISDLSRGKIERFSVDSLVKLLARAGVEVRVSLHTSG
jgi:predicted XRE-type DNA-binding protein